MGNNGMFSSRFSQPTRLFPGSISMALVFFLFFVMHKSLSDGASVPVRPLISEDVESLVSSRILRDHTSSSPTPDPKLAATFSHGPSNINNIINNNAPLGLRRSQISVSGAGSDNMENAEYFTFNLPPSLMDTYSNLESSPTISSPLHVAQCRATCLQKFTGTTPEAFQPRTITPSTTTTTTAEKTDEGTETMSLLPLLRLRRKRSSDSDAFKLSSEEPTKLSCFTDNFECSTCWKSCELLEPDLTRNRKEIINAANDGAAEKDTQSPKHETLIRPEKSESTFKKVQNLKQTKSPCWLADLKDCMAAGCQVAYSVACSFYEQLSTKKGANEQLGGSELEDEATSSMGDPVVRTKHETVVTIIPGKMTWTSAASGNRGIGVAGNKNNNKEAPLSSSDSVVYVVIQEYPDRKWRQIAQTTEQEIGIPKELTSAMKTKLRLVRVLAVGPQGLLAVYSSRKDSTSEKEADEQRSHLDNDGNNSGKAVVVEKGVTAIITKTNENKTQGQKSESEAEHQSVYVNSNGNGNDDDRLEAAADAVLGRNHIPPSPVTDSVTPTTLSPHDSKEMFELRVVSLIHQKSLVIAELRWDEIGGNPNQEYLITWELNGGGLKGHLVTDSTSVTLSLWPDTTYQIQVEEFHENLDADGEQPAVAVSSPTSLKSLPLTVDTSEASFPMERPSALLGRNEEDYYDEDVDEDVSAQEGNESGEGKKEESAHKSIKGAHNMTLALGIASLALGMVLLLLALTAVTWTRMRMTSNRKSTSSAIETLNVVKKKVDCFARQEKCCLSGCFAYCFSSHKEPQLLASVDESSFDDANHKFSVSPLYYVTELKRNNCERNIFTKSIQQYSFNSTTPPHKGSGAQSEVAPVIAVISPSAPAPHRSVSAVAPYYPFSRFYHNNGQRNKNILPSLFTASAAKEAIKSSEQGCSSSSSSSSCWLPDATCTSSSSHDDDHERTSYAQENSQQ